MPFLLPLIAFLLAVFAEFVFRDPARVVRRPTPMRVGAFVLLGVAANLIASRYAPKSEASPLCLGLVFSLVGIVASMRIGREGPTFLLAPLAVGVGLGACVHVLPVPNQVSIGFGLIVGLGIAALCLRTESTSVVAIAATVVVAADYLLGRHSSSPATAYLGSLVGLLAVVGGLIAPWLGKRLALLSGILVGAVILGGEMVGASSVPDHYLGTALAIGVGAALVVGWLLGPEAESADATRSGLSAVIGIGVATITFGLARGAGMAIALTGAVVLLLALGSRRAVLTLGPLFGLVLFRLLAEAHPGASHALDIGQHYGLLGLTLGAVVPLLPADWPNRSKWRDAAGAALWGVVPLGLPPLVYLMFGDKGAIGFVVGLGFSGVCQVLRSGSDLLPTALAGTMGVVTVLSMNWMTASTARDTKVHVLELAGGAILVVAALLALLGGERPHGDRPAARTTAMPEVAG